MNTQRQPSVLHCVRPEIVPADPHYAILSFTTVYTTSGYPEDNGSPQIVAKYDAYVDRKDWMEEIHRRATSKYDTDRQFVALNVNPAKVTTKVQVEVNVS